MSDTFDIGDRPTVTVTFLNETMTLTNPSTVVFSYRRPDGLNVTGLTPTSNPTVGVFTLQLPVLTLPGPWSFRAKATAGLFAAVEGSFNVRMSVFDAP